MSEADESQCNCDNYRTTQRHCFNMECGAKWEGETGKFERWMQCPFHSQAALGVDSNMSTRLCSQCSTKYTIRAGFGFAPSTLVPIQKKEQTDDE